MFYSTYTSTRVSKTNQPGQNPFDIDVQSIIACEMLHCCFLHLTKRKDEALNNLAKPWVKGTLSCSCTRRYLPSGYLLEAVFPLALFSELTH